MLFRFGVILTPESSNVEVFVLGSRVEMGHWDPSGAVKMRASRKLLSPNEPCLWLGDVQLAEPVRDTLWFKFVKRVEGTYIWEGQCCATWLHTPLQEDVASRLSKKRFVRGKIRKRIRHLCFHVVPFVLTATRWRESDSDETTLAHRLHFTCVLNENVFYQSFKSTTKRKITIKYFFYYWHINTYEYFVS